MLSSLQVEYRDAVGFDGYRIGRDGSVLSSRCRNNQSCGWHELSTRLDKYGYLIVGLRRDGKLVTCKVHQLVAAAFNGPMPTGQVCRHLDGNRLNNDPANLAYGTNQDNSDDMLRHGRSCKGERCHSAKLNEKAVKQIRAAHADGIGCNELAERYGVWPFAIYKIVNRISWKQVA